MSFNQDLQHNLIYFYDLPKDTVTSVKLAQIIKEKTGIELNTPAQFKKDMTRFFDSAMVRLEGLDAVKFKEACKNLKYFEIDKKTCRALPFDKEILGQNKIKLQEKNVFVKSIPKDMKPEDLEKVFEQFGSVKSCKISLNSNHESNGYGFVCFENAEDATKAIRETQNQTEIQGEKFAPKDKRDFQKAFNNIYVKNFPKEWSEQQLRETFGRYGEILSLCRVQNDVGAFSFICFGKKDGGDRNYGNECAQRAVKDLHGKQIDETHQWYVKQALSKEERKIEKLKEMMRYKNSKKRCNLYVKNFPPLTTEGQLRDLFEKYGEIESIKVLPKPGEAVYAFVCFKQPDAASTAKQQLHQSNFQGKQLYVNHYEIKEQRKQQMEEVHDKADFQNYKKQNTNLQDLLMRPDLMNAIQQLMFMIQPRLNQQNRRQAGPMQQRGRGMMNNRQMNPNMGGHNQGQHIMQQQMKPNNMGMMPQPMPQQMIPPPMPQMMMQGGMQMTPLQQQYLGNTIRISAAVVPENPNYKAQVGEAIYEFVEKIAGENKAPKITGMLIDLSVEEIRAYLANYDRLVEKVNEAAELLQ